MKRSDFKACHGRLKTNALKLIILTLLDYFGLKAYRKLYYGFFYTLEQSGPFRMQNNNNYALSYYFIFREIEIHPFIHFHPTDLVNLFKTYPGIYPSIYWTIMTIAGCE